MPFSHPIGAKSPHQKFKYYLYFFREHPAQIAKTQSGKPAARLFGCCQAHDFTVAYSKNNPTLTVSTGSIFFALEKYSPP